MMRRGLLFLTSMAVYARLWKTSISYQSTTYSSISIVIEEQL